MPQERKTLYDHKKIETTWKEKWYADNIYEAVDFSPKPKKYILAELPYPSGPYLHAGHMMRYTVPDMYSKYLSMCGYNVLYPMGWDSFGLPTEGFAIKANKTPQELIAELSASFKESLQDMGYSFDWNREINTCDPNYYKWTQWVFLKLYENGLAELKETSVWWSESLGILAEEEVINSEDGYKVAERDGKRVERRVYKQWVLKMPNYAQKLLDGLEETDFPDYIKTAQRNWIGKSDGAEAGFTVHNGTGKEIDQLKVFTTRPDTLFGVTFLAIAPEHPVVKRLLAVCSNKDEVASYVDKAKDRSDMDRKTEKEKTGIKIKGIFAKHPFDEVVGEIPIFVADYILMDYATGSIMGVPAHDERDHDFAQKYDVEIIEVIKPAEPTESPNQIFTGAGTMINSSSYNGIKSEEFYNQAIARLLKEKKGAKTTACKMRDWIFSRQRYWGEPIPLVHKQDGSIEAIVSTANAEEVDEKLPLELPLSKDFQPGQDGSPPLAKLTEWVNTLDRQGNPAKRETQTMPTWAGSSWYFLRYIDPHNSSAFADFEKLKYWLPVDKYFGDGGHTTVHLLYSRFWHRFLYDQGLVPTPEPYKWRMTGGLLLGPDGKKMSKRYGNVVMPSDLVANYGADATRLAIAFLGPYEETYPWNENTIKAMWRLVKTIYDFKDKVHSHDDLVIKKSYNKMVKNITDMCENLKMNTAISEIMIFVNELKKTDAVDTEIWKGFIKVIAPFMPFVAEELWQEINGFTTWDKNNSVHWQSWPEFDNTENQTTSVAIPVMINGKVRGQIMTDASDTEETLNEKILADEKIAKHLQSDIKKFVFVSGKIVSIQI